MSDGTLSTWLMSMIEPIVKKTLGTLGVGWVTYEGITNLGDSLKENVISAWSSTSGTVYDLLSLAGFTDGLGIILGAMSMVLTLAAVAKLGKMIT